MSYCSFDTDDFGSDVYVFCSGQYVIHVAWMRTDFDRSLLPPALPEKEPIPRRVARVLLMWPFTGNVLGSRWLLGTKLEPLDDYELEIDRRLATVVALKRTGTELPLESPHAGQTYRVDTPEECVSKLLELRADGIRVPQRALDRLKREIRDA